MAGGSSRRGGIEVEQEAGDLCHVGGVAKGEPFFAKQGRDDSRGEDGFGVAARELGTVGGDGGELLSGDGRDGDAKVGGFGAEVGRVECWRVAEEGTTAFVLGCEEAAGEGGEEQGGRRLPGCDGFDDGVVEGEVVGVAVGTIGAEGCDDIGRDGLEAGLDGWAEGRVAGEGAVG